MADRALYYPYIHIRDIDWLKATLLMFSQVRRMTPVPGRQRDDGPISPFTESYGQREPMLTSTNLRSHRSVVAQIELARRLREDAENRDFRERYGRFATEAMRKEDDYGFQIHQGKLHEDLKRALRDSWLAWQPGTKEPYALGQEYVEVHPRIGQAVMATLAVACAIAEGLDIVGDWRSGPLHDCLVGKQPKDVYDAWLNPEQDIPEPLQADGSELFEFVVSVACDTSSLDIQALAEIGGNREPIRQLMRALSERAKEMGAMDPGKERTEQFKDETAKILKAWEQDRANMDNYWKQFFGVGLLDTGGAFLQKFIDKAADAAPTISTATTGALAGLVLRGPLVAAGAGLGIGLFTRAAKVYSDLRKRDRDSPYRYLTLMEHAGVVIRTDLRHMASSP